MDFIIGFLGALGFFAFASLTFLLGWFLCSEDAEARLKGEKPVDDYWRKRGMKDFDRRQV